MVMWAVNRFFLLAEDPGTHIRLTIDQSLLSDAQHAYRKGRSTDTALHSLASSIGFHNKEYSLAAFLDIEGAFNNVTPTAINGALTGLGIERPIVGLIHTMLTSRVVYSTMGTAHSTRNVSRGTTQGATLTSCMGFSGQQTAITSRRVGH